MEGQPLQNAAPVVHETDKTTRKADAKDNILKTGFNGGPFPFDASDLFPGVEPLEPYTCMGISADDLLRTPAGRSPWHKQEQAAWDAWEAAQPAAARAMAQQMRDAPTDPNEKAMVDAIEESLKIQAEQAKNDPVDEATKAEIEPDSPNCAQCGKPALGMLRCTGCRRVYYCGKDCQVSHWRAGHRGECPWTAKRKAAKAKAKADAKAKAEAQGKHPSYQGVC